MALDCSRDRGNIEMEWETTTATEELLPPLCRLFSIFVLIASRSGFSKTSSGLLHLISYAISIIRISELRSTYFLGVELIAKQ